MVLSRIKITASLLPIIFVQSVLKKHLQDHLDLDLVNYHRGSDDSL